jgi:peptide/nickel transport system substrate-binding protein
MRTRREFLTSLFSAGAVGLIVACGGGGSQAPTSSSGLTSATSAPAAPAAAPTPAAAAQTAPAQTAPAQAASKPAAAGGTLTFAIETDPIDFDPMLSRALYDRYAQYQMYDSLVRVDPSGKIIPWLAEKWDLAPDGKKVTFTLRQGVKYQDGSPFDADSVKWNLDRYRTTDGSARKGELAPVASVDVIDPATVALTLSTPFSPLLATLVDRSGMMVSRQVVESAGQDFTRKPFKAGTGPFIMTEAVKDDHITFEKNPDWWGTDSSGAKLPLLDKVIFHTVLDSNVRLTNVKTGDAQYASNIAGKDVSSVKTDSTLSYAEVPGYAYDSLPTNRTPGFLFNEARYVKAVNLAIDRQEVLDKAFFGLGVVGYGAVAPGHFAFDPNFKPYEKADPDAAKALVDQVGKGPLSFELLVPSGDPATLQEAQLIQAQLRRASIDAQLTELEFAQILKQQTDHTFKGMTFLGWSGRIDPDGNTYDFNYTGRPNNDGNYSNPDVDRLLDQQRQSSDQNERTMALRQAEQIYVVDDPVRVYFRFRVAQQLTTTKVQSIAPYPDGVPRFQFASLAK